MRVKLKGSKGTTLELNANRWAEAIAAAQRQGWRWNQSIDGKQVITAADANRLSQALKKAGRNGYGDSFVYLADFLTNNSIMIEKEPCTCTDCDCKKKEKSLG